MNSKIIIGNFGKVFGVKGWIRVNSFTEPKSKILTYFPWYIRKNDEWHVVIIEASNKYQQNLIVKLPAVIGREQARFFTNAPIAIEKKQLPILPKGEYCRYELENLTVIGQNNQTLGKVAYILATGANDVLVIKGDKEYLIPYINDVVTEINTKDKVIKVKLCDLIS